MAQVRGEQLWEASWEVWLKQTWFIVSYLTGWVI